MLSGGSIPAVGGGGGRGGGVGEGVGEEWRKEWERSGGKSGRGVEEWESREGVRYISRLHIRK